MTTKTRWIPPQTAVNKSKPVSWPGHKQRNNKPPVSAHKKTRSRRSAPKAAAAGSKADADKSGNKSGKSGKARSPVKRGRVDPAAVPAGERIQKVMARAGLGSRRQLEQAIAAGQVLVNGKVASLGEQLKLDDRVEYNGISYSAILNQTLPETLLYNKPVGIITTRNDPEGRKTVFDKVPAPQSGRWVAVGRLDINTSGLLILTTDGELANAMMHPSTGVDREYACRIHGEVSEDMLQTLRDGVQLDDGMARFTDIARAGAGETNQWFQVTLMEGRQHEVRRLWASQGVEVSRLQRVRHGAVFLPKGLKRGDWQKITPREHRIMREDVGLRSLSVELMLKKAGVSARSPQSQSTREQKYRQQKPGWRKPGQRKSVKSKRGQPNGQQQASTSAASNNSQYSAAGKKISKPKR